MAPTREQVESAVWGWAMMHPNFVRKNHKQADRRNLLVELAQHLQTTLPDFKQAQYPGDTVLKMLLSGMKEFKINASDKQDAVLKGFPETVQVDKWQESIAHREDYSDVVKNKPKGRSKRNAEDPIVQKPCSKRQRMPAETLSGTTTRSRTAKSAERGPEKAVTQPEASEVGDSDGKGTVAVESLNKPKDNRQRLQPIFPTGNDSPVQTAAIVAQERSHTTKPISIEVEQSKSSQQQVHLISLPTGTDIREIGFMETMKTFITDTSLNGHTEPSEIREEMATLSPIITDAINCGLKASGIDGSKITMLEPSTYCADLQELLVYVFGNLRAATHELADVQVVQRLRFDTFLESLLAADLTQQVFEAPPQGNPDSVDVRDRNWIKVIKRELGSNARSWLEDAVKRSIIEDEVLPKTEAKATALARRFMDMTTAFFAAPAAPVMDLRVYGLTARAKWEMDEAASYQFVFPRFKTPFSDETHESIQYWHAMGKPRQGRPERVFVTLLPTIYATYGEFRDKEWAEPVVISPAKVVTLPRINNTEATTIGTSKKGPSRRR